MLEWTRADFEQQKEQSNVTAFYLYTPLCGTCQVAGKMMDVVAELVKDVPIGKANLNYLEDLAIDYEIESVPCLVITENGELKEKIYAFQSVPHLYEKLKK
ncbi:thioredoxin family protein [Chungangia koreensis]|uniref:Thioredoxin family protein n=1 Tax=Chungangia koreensis TaxID=752657 RepID=A0ABV8X800_9LACT